MTRTLRGVCSCVEAGIALAAGMGLLLALAIPSRGQAQGHGFDIQKNCVSPKSPGEAVDCTFTAVHTDSVGNPGLGTDDSSQILAVRDEVLGQTFTSSDIPIVSVSGNTNCQVSNPNPASTVLPCRVCRAGSTHCGLTAVDPGFGAEGRVDFRVIGPVIQMCPASGPIPDTAFADWVDNCESQDPGCTAGTQLESQASSTTCIPVIPPSMMKMCPNPEDPTKIKLIIDNPGGALSNCTIVDTAFLDDQDGDGMCEGTGTPVDIENQIPEPLFTIPAGAVDYMVTYDNPFPGENYCDRAELRCGNPQATVATDDDPCEAGTDNFKCYKAKFDPRERFDRRDVELTDQFGTIFARTLLPYDFCNPVDKNGEGIENPQRHFMCYKLFAPPERRRHLLRGTDQFGSEELTVTQSRLLCNPAVKNEDGELADVEAAAPHLGCYLASTTPRTTPLDPPVVSLADQFESQDYDPTGTGLWCNPLTEKDGNEVFVPQFPDPFPFTIPDGPEPSSDVHYKCYDIVDPDAADPDAVPPPFAGAEVLMQDQFHPDGVRIRAGRPTRLCEPAVKQVFPR